MTTVGRAIKTPGLIENGKTFSLVVQDGKLFVLYLGPGNLEVRGRGIAGAVGAQIGASIMERKIQEGEARLAAEGIESISQHKHSMVFPLSEISEVDVNTGYKYHKLQIKTPNKKLKLHIPVEYADELELLAKAIS